MRRYQYMIDNVILLITGTLHERDTEELISKCHPLGMFDSIKALCVATNARDLFQTVLIDTPLGAAHPHPTLTLHPVRTHACTDYVPNSPVLSWMSVGGRP